VFYTNSRTVSKRILELSTGNNELYARRRKPDSIDVQEMKTQAKNEREKRKAERLSDPATSLYFIITVITVVVIITCPYTYTTTAAFSLLTELNRILFHTCG